MKVLHVEAGRYLYGGAQRLSGNEGLARRGIENVLVCPTGADIATAVAGSARVHAIKMSGDLDLGLVPRLTRILKAESRISSIFTVGVVPISMVGCSAYRGDPGDSFATVDNKESRVLSPFKYALYGRVIVISKAIGSVLVSCGVDASRLKQCEAPLMPTPTAQKPIKTGLRLSFPCRVTQTLGVIAQLIPRKGHKYLLNILPQLLQVRSCGC